MRHGLTMMLLTLAIALGGCASTPVRDSTAAESRTPASPQRPVSFAQHLELLRSPGFADPMIKMQVNEALKPLVKADKFSGALILGRNGRVIDERGMGLAHQERKLPFTPDTAADGASLAKTFTAAAVHLLVAEGKLSLDDPVQRWLPDYPDAATTLRHLITHSNGLPDYDWFDPHFPKGSVRQSADLLAVLAKQNFKPAFTPGTRFVYGNVGFDLAGLIVERASGQPIAEFFKNRFFDPLGMKASFARPARFADWPGVRTLAYHAPPRASELNDVFDGEGFIGASNLYFTARDLHRWVSAFATGTGLPAAVFDVAARPVQIDGKQSGIRAGNWYCAEAPAGLANAPRCYYTGSLNGFYSLAYWDRATGDTIVYLSNSSFQGADTPVLDRKLLGAMAMFHWFSLRLPLPHAPPIASVSDSHAYIEVSAPTRPRLVGTYLAAPHSMNIQVALTADGKRLTLQRDGGLVYDLFKISPTLFYLPGLDAQVGFSGSLDAPVLHLRSLFLDLDARRQP